MTAEYNAFSRPAFTAADFERADTDTASTSPMFSPPIYGRENGAAARRSGMPAAAWIAVPVIALALGAGVYALNPPHRANAGVAQLTPGVPAAATPMATRPVETARTDPTPAMPAPERMAAETLKAPMRTAEASPRVSAKVAPPRHTVTRSAPSAMATGVNTSASAPAQVQAPPPVVVAPPAPVVSAAPEPATQPTPQAAPETPPTTPPNS